MTDRKALSSAIRIACTVAAALALLLGQVAIFKGNYRQGGVDTILGLFVLGWVWLLPPGFLGRLIALLKQRPRAVPLPLAKGARGKGPQRVAATQRALPTLTWRMRWTAWRPFANDEVVVARLWLAIAGMLCLLLAGLAVGLGKVLPGILLACLGALPFAIYLQAPEQPLTCKNLNAKFKIGTLIALGLIPQIFSTKILWDYRYVLTGTAITAVAVIWQLLALSKLADREALSGPAWHAAGRWPAADRLWVKAALVVGAVAVAWVAKDQLNAFGYLAFVLLNFLAIFLLLLSFPWLPGSTFSLAALPAPMRSGLAGGGAVLAFVLAVSAQTLMNQGQIHKSLWLYLAAGILLILSLPSRNETDKLRDKAMLSPDTAPQSQLSRRIEIFVFLALVLVATGLRVWHVGTFPWAAEGDEAGGGLWALLALHGTVDNPIIHQNLPLTFISVTSLAFKLFGITVGTLRAHAVIFGVLSLVAMYFFFRLVTSWRSAFLATAVAAFAYWHLHYSRFGHYNIEQVFAQTVAYYFLFKSEKTGRFAYAVAGGAAFALAMMPHMAGRLLPFSMILYFAYLLLYRRDLVSKRWVQYAAFVLAAWMVLSPALVFWVRAATFSMGRAKSVSIFDKTNTNAPRDPTVGFVENAKSSILMFNYMGDTRNRDNPMAPQQIVEAKASALLALAFMFVLYHWRDPLNAFLLACFFINLAASAFSVEAPQALRSAGNLGIIFAFFALVFEAFKTSLEGFGRRAAVALSMVILLPLVTWFGYLSFHKYFIEGRDLAFDVMPTLVSQEGGKRSGQNYILSFWATGFVQSHPPVELFKLDTPVESHADLLEVLPFRARTSFNQALALCDDYQAAEPYVMSLYPGAKRTQLADIRKDYLGMPLGVILDIPATEVAKTLGCELKAVKAGGATVDLGPRPIEVKAGSELSAYERLEWAGSIFIPDYATWQLWPKTKGNATISLDGRIVGESHQGHWSTKDQILAKGMHTVRVSYRRPVEAEDFHIEWAGRPIRPGFIHNLRAAVSGPVPADNWLKWKEPQGLLGTYYLSDHWDGDVALKVVQACLLFHYLDPPFGGRWSAEWTGEIKADQSGTYAFNPIASGYFDVEIDGHLVQRSGSPLQPVLKPRPIVPAQLSAGWHKIRLRFVTTGSLHMDLKWTGPGITGNPLVPGDHLRPDL